MQINLLAPFYMSFISFGVVLTLVTGLVEGNALDGKRRSEDYAPILSPDPLDENAVVAVDQTAADSWTRLEKRS